MMQQNHRILSVNTQTLISQRKERQNPIFYDNESNLAKQCLFAEQMYNQCPIINDDQLLNDIKKKLILEETLNYVDNYDKRLPVTPDSSDCEDNNHHNHQKNAFPSFGETINSKMSSITEITKELQLLNEDGNNILNNNNNNRNNNDFGIYNESDIYKQVTRFDKNKYLNGNDLIRNATKQSRKNRKKKRRERVRAKQQQQQQSLSGSNISSTGSNKRRRRRGGRKNKKHDHKYENDERNEDEIKCGNLVSYLEQIQTNRSY